MNYLHCDHTGCGNHVRAGGMLAADWYTVSDGSGDLAHACSLDHLMRWASNSEPLEEIPL